MRLSKLSPPAYFLRKKWELEDKRAFIKFRKDEGKLQVVNALAEMIVRMQAERQEKTLAHF